MHAEILTGQAELAALCRERGVVRLEAFGSAARGRDFDPERSDVDFLVAFSPDRRNDLLGFEDFRLALETLLGRRVDLVERVAIEQTRNFIRRDAILAEAEPVFG